jgi:hypothetical protein
MELVVAILVIAFLGSNALAGTISSTPAPVASGPGLGLVSVPAIVTVNINNDNQTGGGASDNNIVIPLKRFDSNNLIDIVFSLGSTDGTTEYKVTEFVDNNTGIPWSSYKMQLGTGTGAQFVPFTTGGLDFDAPGFDTPPSSGVFPVVATSPYELNYSGGLQGTGAQQHVFRLDIPDAGNTFTLRQIPTAIPEPGLLGLMCSVVLSAFAVRRAR